MLFVTCISYVLRSIYTVGLLTGSSFQYTKSEKKPTDYKVTGLENCIQSLNLININIYSVKTKFCM